MLAMNIQTENVGNSHDKVGEAMAAEWCSQPSSFLPVFYFTKVMAHPYQKITLKSRNFGVFKRREHIHHHGWLQAFNNNCRASFYSAMEATWFEIETRPSSYQLLPEAERRLQKHCQAELMISRDFNSLLKC